MIDRKKLVLLAGIFILSAAIYMSATTTFVVLLLGFTIVPPVLMVSAAIYQGLCIFSESLGKLEKERIVISD